MVDGCLRRNDVGPRIDNDWICSAENKSLLMRKEFSSPSGLRYTGFCVGPLRTCIRKGIGEAGLSRLVALNSLKMNRDKPFSPIRASLIRAERPSSDELWTMTGLDRANLMLTLRGTFVFDYEADLDNPARSLAAVLSFYPHLSGRMERGRWIRLTDEGVPFSVRDATTLTAAEVAQRPNTADRFSLPLSKGRIKSGRIAPMNVTVTRLKDGFVLGVRCAHACLDGFGFYSMIHCWSKVARKESVSAPTFDQSVVPTPTGRPMKRLKKEALERGWRPLGFGTAIRALFHLVKGTFKCRAEVAHISDAALRGQRAELVSATGLPLSRHEALCSYIAAVWAALFGHPGRNGPPNTRERGAVSDEAFFAAD